MKKLFPLDVLVIVALLCVLKFSAVSYADSIYYGVRSHHFNGSQGYNENNKLIGVEYNGWLYARFINSYNDQSRLLAKVDKWGDYKCVEYGMKLGVVKGYGDRFVNIKGWSPFLTLYTTCGFVDLNIAPGVITSGFRFRF